MLKGFVIIDGPLICKAEIQVQNDLWKKSAPVFINWNPDSPPEIPQFRTFRRFIDLSISSLNKAFRSKSWSDCHNRLKLAKSYCLSAAKILENPENETAAHASLNIGQSELYIKFCIQKFRLETTVQFLSTNFSNVSSQSLRSHSKNSSSFDPQSLNDQIRVESVIPLLTACHEIINYVDSRLTECIRLHLFTPTKA